MKVIRNIISLYIKIVSGKYLLGYQVKNIQENIRVVSKNLFDILPCIEMCTDHKDDKDSIIPFAKSNVDLLFLVSEDDGVTNSVQQVRKLNISLLAESMGFEVP